MPRPARPLMLLLLLGCVPAMAETLQCRSVNGNVTCAGDGAVSCQTVNGRTTCIGGGGAIVQEFGGSARSGMTAEAEEAAEARMAGRPAARARRQWTEGRGIERQMPRGPLSPDAEDTWLRLHRNAPATD